MSAPWPSTTGTTRRERDLLDVVVVGAGVVGAAAALAFARDGLQVALVETREPPRWNPASPDLRVYAFAPDNAALLDDLGVWSGVLEARAQPYRAMRVWDAAGGGELAFDADAFARRELGWIVEHALLVDRLWAALPAAGVQLHCPEQVVALEQGEGSASLELASGRRLRARLVVAADGASSQLRQLAGIDAVVHDYGQNGLVAYVDSELPHRQTCWQRFLPTGPLAFLPVADAAEAFHPARSSSSSSSSSSPARPEGGGHRSSIVWTLPESECQRLQQLDDEAFATELQSASGGTLGALRMASPRAAFPLRRQLAERYVAGRLVLVGDAAHVVHPLAGQGVNLGLRDVASLRGLLRGAGRSGVARGADLATPSRLQRWARVRRSENAIAAQAFSGLNRLFSNDAVAATLLRGPLLGLVGRLPALTHAFWRRAAGV